MAVIDPGGATVYGYTDGGRLADVWDPTGTTGSTCATVATVSGNKGHVRYVYDGRGNRLERHAWDDTAPTRNELVEHWTFTLDDRPAVYADAAGRPTTTSYTLTAGRLTSKATQTGDVTDIDGAGNAASSKRVTTEDYLPNGAVGTVTARSYDASNNVTGSTVVGYSHDTVGRRKQVIANPGASQTVNTFTYNSRDQVTSLAYQNGTSASYSWNLGGLQTNASYPNGAYWRFLYDPAGRVQEVDIAAFATWNPVATYTYTAGGRPAAASLAGTAGSRTYTVDPSTGATTRMLQTVGGTTTNFDMAFDNDGRLALDCRYTHTAPCAPATDKPVTYGYDAASQLTSATVANPAVGDTKAWGYTYGNRGNRTSATVTTKTSGTDTVATTAYTTDSTGQLTAATSTSGGDHATWRYDKAGRRLATVRTTGENQTLTYDPVGRLAGRVTSGGQWNGTEARTYDALGSLTNVSITNGSTNTVALAWDHSGRDSVPQVTVATYNGLNTQYSYGIDRITLQNYTGYWFNYDDLGSTIYKPVTAYTPNGAPTPATTATDWHYFGYRAELTIANLVHLRNRDYDPTTATFTTRDPVGGVDGTTTVANPYHYTNNDPLNKVDPLGLRPTEGPCSEFSSTGAVIDARTCQSALELWNNRDRSISDCAAVGGANYGGGTCYLPPRSHQQKDFCFPPVKGDDVVSLGPNGSCGVWSVEIHCARFSNSVTDAICQHREGILKVAGYALIPAAILVTVATGGAAGAPTAGAILSLTSGSLLISAEALDDKPCRSQRVTVTAVLVILGGGVGGSFSAGGLVAGEAVTSGGLAGLESVNFQC